MWCGISDGAIDVVATDHCTFQWLNACKFLKAISVAAQMAYRRGKPHAVTVFQWRDDGTYTPERFVELTSAMPARLFGLWRKKDY